jgi:hypothetical protein
MAVRPKNVRRTKIPASRIKGFVRDLTVVDVDVAKIGSRLSGGISLDDSASCIIDITCCIIDCSKCRPDEIEIFENPANELEGFAFRLKDQAGNPMAPLYYLPSIDARSAMRMGHGSVQIPGGKVAGKMIGLAGQFFDAARLKRQKVAPTAPVIALSAKKAASSRAAAPPSKRG